MTSRQEDGEETQYTEQGGQGLGTSTLCVGGQGGKGES